MAADSFSNNYSGEHRRQPILSQSSHKWICTFCVLHARFSDVGAAPMARPRNRTKNDASSL
ncbi:Ff.00g050940.m01.CDS01 [Fusarium sp. VM40]|nr:Ff.00g050940.m01.CDS01 [Fusarium sp. VM40]